MMWIRGVKAGALALALMCPAPLLADRGDVGVGASLALSMESRAGGQGTLRVGLSDFLALEFATGVEASTDQWGLIGAGALVGSLDVLEWVPEVLLGWEGALYSGQLRGAFLGRLQIRRFYSMGASWWVGFGGRIPVNAPGWEALGGAGLTWHLN